MGSVKYNELSNRWIVGIVTLWNGDVNIIFRSVSVGIYESEDTKTHKDLHKEQTAKYIPVNSSLLLIPYLSFTLTSSMVKCANLNTCI